MAVLSQNETNVRLVPRQSEDNLTFCPFSGDFQHQLTILVIRKVELAITD